MNERVNQTHRDPPVWALAACTNIDGSIAARELGFEYTPVADVFAKSDESAEANDG